jgi:unspecific monooxygenase
MPWPHGSLLPDSLQTAAYLTAPTRFLARQQARHGAAFRVRTPMYGEQLFLADPEDLEAAFAADPDALRGGEANVVLRQVVGARSVSSLDGPEHRARRRLLGPVLQAARPSAEALHAAVHGAFTSLPRGRPVPLRPLLRRLAMSLMLRTLFGPTDGQDPEALALGETFARMVDLGAMPLAQLGVLPALQRDLGRWSPWGAFRRELDRVDAAIFRRIDRCRGALAPGGEAEPGVLGGLLRAEAEGALTTQDLRDDLFTLLGAGFETTAMALAWAFEEILRRPALRERIRDARGVESDPETAPLLGAVLRESLRLHPVLPTVARRVASPLALRGRALPPGTSVVLCLYLAQRSRGHVDRPEEFLPERFLDDRGEAIPWWPFGGGSRRCPGMGLALRQMRWTVATALRSADLALAWPGPALPVFRGSTLAPAGGTWVVRR